MSVEQQLVLDRSEASASACKRREVWGERSERFQSCLSRSMREYCASSRQWLVVRIRASTPTTHAPAPGPEDGGE